MYFDERRWLPAAIVSQQYFSAPFAAAAQTSTSPHATIGTAACCLFRSPPRKPLGDSLMAHRRYQAAIEAYRQGPQTPPPSGTKWASPIQMMFNLQDALAVTRSH